MCVNGKRVVRVRFYLRGFLFAAREPVIQADRRGHE